MPTPYEAATASLGDVRLYLDTSVPLDPQQLKPALGCRFAHGREHRTASDPWEYAFGGARRLESENSFYRERDRVVRALLTCMAGEWDANLVHYPQGQSLLYHWSSSEGTLHPYRVFTE